MLEYAPTRREPLVLLEIGMRLIAVQLQGVGGLADGRVELPLGPVAAFAGANGTGKSKLLACLLSPWSQAVPSPRAGEAAEVTVEFRLTQEERVAIAELSVTAGWGQVEIPELVKVRTTNQPMVGIQRHAEPAITVLTQIWTMQPFLQETSSLNVIYLPAERRLLPPNQTGIDLAQLSELIAWQKNAESRNAAQNYGRLDDQEFEQFAKALCVSDTLPSDDEESNVTKPRIQWPEFAETVDSLIAPKRLMPLTREHSDQLRVKTANGDTHSVQELSSGERQALIIISRVLRAGAGHTVVLIDEPDAYLHPHLSQRLIQALESGVGADGQLIVATHSPSILDGVSPNGILRLSHRQAPRLVATESDRVELYRSAGFRASALTQSDLLLITEGESDSVLLSLLFPALTRASVRSAGGKARVLREVEQLAPYELPVLGVVDRDVNVGFVPPLITVWPTADIEGVFLSDDVVLQVMIEKGLIKPQFSSVASLRDLLTHLCLDMRENVIAEMAQAILRVEDNDNWPTPKGDSPLQRLRDAVTRTTPVTEAQVEVAISSSEEIWNSHRANLFTLVRGKYVLNAFASQVSEMKSGRALLEAVARARPQLSGFQEFDTQLKAVLG